MTVRQCLCKTQLRPTMLVYRHFCGGTIIGEVTRVNERSVRIRKLNDAGTCMSDEHVTLKFKPSCAAEIDQRHDERTGLACWCVTDIHELTPEVAQEKYFRDLLVGCNPYIAKKIGWAERMSAVKEIDLQSPVTPRTTTNPDLHTIDALNEAVHKRSAQGAAGTSVTDFISSGKYKNMKPDRLQRIMRADLEIAHGARRALHIAKVTPRRLDMLWNIVWKHAHAGAYGLHDVVYWYGELWPLVAPCLGSYALTGGAIPSIHS